MSNWFSSEELGDIQKDDIKECDKVEDLLNNEINRCDVMEELKNNPSFNERKKRSMSED